MLGLRAIPGTHPWELPAGPSGEAGRVPPPPAVRHIASPVIMGVDGGGLSRPRGARGSGQAWASSPFAVGSICPSRRPCSRGRLLFTVIKALSSTDSSRVQEAPSYTAQQAAPVREFPVPHTRPLADSDPKKTRDFIHLVTLATRQQSPTGRTASHSNPESSPQSLSFHLCSSSGHQEASRAGRDVRCEPQT